MELSGPSPEEIVIVGSRYVKLTDMLNSLYEKKEPVERKEIIDVFEDDMLLLSHIPNPYDKYCVAVSTIKEVPVGHVWMYQAPAIYKSMIDRNIRYLKVRITKVCKIARVLKAVPEYDIDLSNIERTSFSLDPGWANNLPDVRMSITEYSLGIGVDLLYDCLKDGKTWGDEMALRLKNVIDTLPQDLSASHYQKNYDVYWMMDRSEDAEIQRQSEVFLYALIHRGSSCQMKRWLENWLPEFIQEVEECMTVSLYQYANYDLARIEAILESAPNNLYYIYKTDMLRFAKNLYYAALPENIYYRLLTLLAVRELMKGESREVKSVVEKARSPKSGGDNEDIIAKLKPMFFGNEDEARSFLNKVIDMKPKQITTLVNKYVREKKLSELSCHRELYIVLHESGIYKPTESNWNQQVI